MTSSTPDIIRSALPRYGRVPRDLLRDPNLSDRAVRLYGLLDDYAGSDGKAFPSRQTLADAMGCSLSAVDRVLRELDGAGWMLREPRMAGGRQSSNLYTLTAGPQAVDEPVDGGSSPVTTLVTRDDPPSSPVTTREGESQEGSSPRKPPKGRPTVSDDDPHWSRFWSLFPRKTGKGAARTAWVRAVAKVDDPEVILTAAKRFAGGITEVRYCPHPTTWLNQERWLDAPGSDAEPERRRNVRAGSSEECPIHAGEHRDHCRGCAADAKAKD